MSITLKDKRTNTRHYQSSEGGESDPKDKKEAGIDHYKSKWNGEIYHTLIFSKFINKTKYRLSSTLSRF